MRFHIPDDSLTQQAIRLVSGRSPTQKECVPVYLEAASEVSQRRARGRIMANLVSRARRSCGSIMDRGKEYQAQPNMEHHSCFGCSPINPAGLHMKFYSRGETVYSWLTVPEHLCGWKTLVHGGVISTILDEISARAVIYRLKAFGLTRSMEIRFIKPIYIGTEVRAEGRILEVKGAKDALVHAALFDGKDRLCAESTGTISLVTLDRVEEMGMADEEMVRWFQFLVRGDSE